MSEFQRLVSGELKRVRENHGTFNSAHEGYGVLLEEVDELWDEVKKKRSKRSSKAMLEELVQIATVAQRFAEDLILKG